MSSGQDIDVLLVIALDEEWHACKAVLPGKQVAARFEDALGTVSWDLDYGGAPLLMEVGVVNLMSGRATAARTALLIARLKPRQVINIGIAAAIDDDLRLGDVVLGDRVEEYSYRQRLEDSPEGSATDMSTAKYGGRAIPLSEAIVRTLRKIQTADADNWLSWRQACSNESRILLGDKVQHRLFEAKLMREPFRAVIGPIASGDFLIGSESARALIKSWNRTFLAAEMECAGIASASACTDGLTASTIIIKGMSDFGDDRKKSIDEIGGGAVRRLAMQNATRLFACLIAETIGAKWPVPEFSDKSSLESLHEQVCRSFADPYTSEYQLASWDAYSSFFGQFGTIKKPAEGQAPFDFTAHYQELAALKTSSVTTIVGDSGTGKTTLLQILYWKARIEAQHGGHLIPLYFDQAQLREAEPDHYPIVGPQEGLASSNQIRQKIFLEAVRSIPEKMIPLIIVEGSDEDMSFDSGLLREIQVLRKGSTYHIVAAKTKHTGDLYGLAIFHVSLGAVQTNGFRAGQLIENFLKIARPSCGHHQEQRFRRTLERCNFRHLELFSLGMAWDCACRPGIGEISSSYIEELRGFCRMLLSRSDVKADAPSLAQSYLQACQLAFAKEMKGVEVTRFSRKGADNAARMLVLRHEKIRDFLTAEYLCRSFSRNRQSQDLDHVYPYRINRLLKDIVNLDARSQERMLKGLRAILKDSDRLNLLAHTCYLVGRFTDGQCKVHGLDELKRFQERLDRRIRPKHQERQAEILLLQRTLYLSCIYLGDADAHTRYVEKLLTDKSWNEVNRGFHLEYYGDIPYDPNLSLTNRDHGGSWEITLAQLCERLENAAENPLYTIEAITLASLAQHRLELGKCAVDARELVGKTLSLALNSNRIRNHSAKLYIEMIVGHLERQSFSIGEMFLDFYKIKEHLRAGWTKRKLPVSETIAAHSYGAYLIGLFFLPDALDHESGYDKNRILKMLLVHDLAEGITGDVATQDKTEADREQERRIMEQIRYLGTFSALGSFTEVSAIWIEFEDKVTMNAKLANEIDRIENLLQLREFVRRGITVADAETWERGLRDAVKTDTGLKILDHFVQIA